LSPNLSPLLLGDIFYCIFAIANQTNILPMAKTENEVRFYLKDKNANGETLVFVRHTLKTGERLKYSTGEKVNPKFWSDEEQRATTTDKTTKLKHKDTNLQLERYVDAITKINSYLDREDLTPTLEFFKTELDKEFKKASVVKTKTNLLTYAELFYNQAKAGERLTKDDKCYEYNTVKQFKTALNHLKAFSKVYKCLEFEQLDLIFYNTLLTYLTKKNFTKNAIGSIIKNVKIFIKGAYNDGLHTNLIFKDEKFTTLSESVENIYLDLDELNLIYSLNLSNKPRLDRVRDLFLIGCYSGLRFSDVSQLQAENLITVDGKIYLKVITQKTGQPVTIPIMPNLQAIFDKYKGVPPKPLSNQKMNDYLKELGQLIELDDKVQLSQTKGGKKVIRTLEKWKMFSTHTARRSFATNAYLAKIPTLDIMKMTGHKTETSFLKYIKVTDQQVAVRLSEHPYFSGGLSSDNGKVVKLKTA
jgi:integrase